MTIKKEKDRELRYIEKDREIRYLSVIGHIGPPPRRGGGFYGVSAAVRFQAAPAGGG
jgi:hypothetical protein